MFDATPVLCGSTGIERGGTFWQLPAVRKCEGALVSHGTRTRWFARAVVLLLAARLCKRVESGCKPAHQ